MKNILKTMIWSVLLVLTSCKDNVDCMTGKYALDTYRMNQVSSQQSTKVGKGVKKIEVSLTDGTNVLELAFGTKEWILPAATYSYSPSNTGNYSDVVTNGTFAARLLANGVEVPLSNQTNITISKNNKGEYSIILISLLEENNNIKALYSGAIAFEIGEDDPEASGYTISITENPVTDADNITYPELTKYAIIIADPNGIEVCEMHTVNKANASLKELVGSYTIAGYPTESWLMDNGWVVYMPEYNFKMAGGTYYTDVNNTKQYVTSGTINITTVEDANGVALYSFSGSALNTLTAENMPGTNGSFNIMFASEMISNGTVLNDLTINSNVLGMEMKYSVYLPQSWDGVKTFPVLYLLHGADGGNNDWLTGGKIDTQVAAAVTEGKAPEMIVIMPNCTVNGKNLFYCNGYQGDAQYMTYFFDEFLPAVEATYKVQSDRARRAIGGLSMGSYGSLYYGSLHPEMVCYVYACSPATYIDGTPNLYDLYGSAAAEGIQLPGITIEIGTSDFLYESARYFKGALDGMGITNNYIERDGAHDWTFWKACTPKIISQLGVVFQ